MTTTRKTQQNPKQQKDTILMVLLIFANIVSGYTTIDGASKVLPIQWAWILGSFIQILLFLALADMIMKTTPWRKWLTVALFTFLSVYTSFFTYYTTLAGNVNTQNEFEKAVQAHNKLVSEVFTPLETALTQQINQGKKYRESAKKSEAGQTKISLPGCYDECKKYKGLATEAEGKVADLQNLIDKIRPMFNYEIEQKKANNQKVPLLTAREIFNKDQEALAAVPKEFLAQNYSDLGLEKIKNYPDLKENNYTDEDLKVALTTPIDKLSKEPKDKSAIAALFIAFGVDVWSVILGTAIANKQSKSVIIMIAEAIAGIKRDFHTLIDSIIKPPTPGVKPQPNEDEIEVIKEIVKQLKLKVKEEGLHFLDEFNDAINFIEPHSINSNKFNDPSNLKFKRGFEYLINKFKKMNWIIQEQNQQFFVKADCYDNVIDWIDKIKEVMEEEKQEINDNYGFSKKKGGN